MRLLPKTKIAKTGLAVLATALLIYGAVLGVDRIFAAISKHGIFSADSVPHKQAVLVLGARIYPDGRLSPVLEDRVLTGVEIYSGGKADKLIMSGDHGSNEYDEVNSAKKLILDLHVPPEDVFLDYAGFDTYDSIYRAKAVFGATDLVIVTQAYHLPRALFIARGLGLDAVGVVADRQNYAKLGYFRKREKLANLKALYDIVFRSEPKYLGEEIPISGDGRSSWDESSFPKIHE